jgi:hypothetical protein
LAVTDISTSAFRTAVKKNRGTWCPGHCEAVVQTCGQMMRYAVANDLAKPNPVADFGPADVLKPHERRNYARVGAREFPGLLHAMDGTSEATIPGSPCN